MTISPLVDSTMDEWNIAEKTGERSERMSLWTGKDSEPQRIVASEKSEENSASFRCTGWELLVMG